MISKKIIKVNPKASFQHLYEVIWVQYLIQCIGLQNISNHGQGGLNILLESRIKEKFFDLWNEKGGKYMEGKEVVILNCLKQYFISFYFVYTKVDQKFNIHSYV